jgi:hypothetical protein
MTETVNTFSFRLQVVGDVEVESRKESCMTVINFIDYANQKLLADVSRIFIRS